MSFDFARKVIIMQRRSVRDASEDLVQFPLKRIWKYHTKFIVNPAFQANTYFLKETNVRGGCFLLAFCCEMSLTHDGVVAQ